MNNKSEYENIIEALRVEDNCDDKPKMVNTLLGR
jgi:hypothetical protein